MKRQGFAAVIVALAWVVALTALLVTIDLAGAGAPAGLVRAASPDAAPAVVAVAPASAPNDLDAPIVVTGSGFAVLPTVSLGDTALDDVGWVSSATLTATVPWGLAPGAYTMTVENPGGEWGALPGAFTVTQGIGAWQAGTLYGGSVDQVVVNPLTPTTLYAASGVGVFRSHDGADHWAFKYAPSGHNLALDPAAPRRIYASGEPHDGGFLWRSDDEGDTWLPLTTTFPVSGTQGRWCYAQIKIYTTPGTVYVADCGGDGGPSGLIESMDYGQTWEPLMNGLTDTQVSALAFHPTDPLTMYLGTVNGNVFTSHDGGDSWMFASQPVSYVHYLAVAPTGTHEVWVSAGNWYGDPCGLYKSANAELTVWTPIGEPQGQPGHEWCNSKTIFPPAAWGHAYSETVLLVSEGDVFASSDDGDTLGALPLGNLSGAVHDLALHPADPNVLYLGESGAWDGFYRTVDGGATWQAAIQGLTAIVPQQMEVVADQPGSVYALSLGKLYLGTQGGEFWQQLPISGVLTFMIDPYTPMRMYAGAAEGIFISEDAGQSWPVFVPITKPLEYAECGMWMNVLSPVPAQPGTLVASARHFSWTGACVQAKGSLYRSTNYGQDWTRLDLGREISQVNDVVYDPISPTILYAAIGNDDETGGDVLKSDDGGAAWASAGAWSLDGVPFLLEMEPGTHRILASVNNRLPLYVSEDGGATWTPTAPGGGHNVQDILFVPGDPPVLYDAAQQGLFRSADGAQSWTQAAGVLGHVPAYSLAAAEAEGRIILYTGTTGGYVAGEMAQAAGGTAAGSDLIHAGIYRYTTLRPRRVYLPLVLRQSP